MPLVRMSNFTTRADQIRHLSARGPLRSREGLWRSAAGGGEPRTTNFVIAMEGVISLDRTGGSRSLISEVTENGVTWVTVGDDRVSGLGLDAESRKAVLHFERTTLNHPTECNRALYLGIVALLLGTLPSNVEPA